MRSNIIIKRLDYSVASTKYRGIKAAYIATTHEFQIVIETLMVQKYFIHILSLYRAEYLKYPRRSLNTFYKLLRSFLFYSFFINIE